MRFLQDLADDALTSGSANPSPTSYAPRLVYLDLGTNWGDTLDLYRTEIADQPQRSRNNWEIYGFEASPQIQRHVDRLTRWKNGVLRDRPISCLPPAGSTHDLLFFAPSAGCQRDFTPKMNRCMSKLLDPAHDKVE